MYQALGLASVTPQTTLDAGISPTEVRRELFSEPVQPQTSHHRCFGPRVLLYLGGATRMLSQ